MRGEAAHNVSIVAASIVQRSPRRSCNYSSGAPFVAPRATRHCGRQIRSMRG